MNIVAILILGGLGGMLRLPLENLGLSGILMVNLIGCLVLSFTTELLAKRGLPSWLHNGMSSGLIGAFTTFASFSTAVTHLVAANLSLAALYIGVSLGGGIILVFTGEQLARLLNRKSHEQPYKNQEQSRENSSTFPKFLWGESNTKPDGD